MQQASENAMFSLAYTRFLFKKNVLPVKIPCFQGGQENDTAGLAGTVCPAGIQEYAFADRISRQAMKQNGRQDPAVFVKKGKRLMAPDPNGQASGFPIIVSFKRRAEQKE